MSAPGPLVPRSSAPAGSRICLSIPAKAEYILLARLALTAIARLRTLPEELAGDLRLALTEACSNSVRHAYADGRGGAIEVVFEVGAESLAVEVRDDGPGFEPRDLEPGGEELGEGGLGIAIIRALSDEFDIGERESGGGSRLRFVKYLE